MKKAFMAGLLAAALAAGPVLGGCGSAAKAPAPAPSSGKTATGTTAAAKTLIVGYVGYLGGLGFDDSRCIQVMADMDNAKGGIDIGGTKYKVKLIIYDDNNAQATDVAAVNRLIFQDHAQVIIGDTQYIASWLPTAEAHKILTFGGNGTTANLNAKWHYTFNGSAANTGFPVGVAWFVQKYPNFAKDFALALPDNQIGHFMQNMMGQPAEVMGAKMHYLYYPPNQTDLSALGTKVKQMNPAVYSATGGGDQKDGLAMTAAWNAGYRGQYYDAGKATVNVLEKIMPAAALNGLIATAEPTEFDPPLTPDAVAFKAAYTARYGKWDDPNIFATGFYACMKAGLVAAGTTDPDKVAAALDNGLKYSGPGGNYQMVPRPDLGIPDRTVDSVSSAYYKTIKDGKAELSGTLSVEKAVGIWNELLKKEAKQK